MRLGIISEAPLLTTGFGVVADQFARQLAVRGWDVSCFGIGFTGRVDCQRPYRMWLSGRLAYVCRS